MSRPDVVADRSEVLVVPIDTDAIVADVARHLWSERLLAVLDGTWVGGGAIVASEPVVALVDPPDPFALLDRLPAVDGSTDGVAVGGGWLGYLGYELGQTTEDLPPPPPRSAVPLPAASSPSTTTCSASTPPTGGGSRPW